MTADNMKLAVTAEQVSTGLALNNLKQALSARSTNFFSLTLPMCPSMNLYWKNFKGRTILSKEAREYKQESLKIISGKKFEHFENRKVDVFLIAYFSDNRRRDIDNYIKPVLDVLKEVVFDDDSQVQIVSAVKLKTTKNASYMEVLVVDHRVDNEQKKI